MTKIWFSSDPHFGHDNIIRYCGRPFKDSIEMDHEMVERHNQVVKPSHHWYCLGDVTMGRPKTVGIRLEALSGHPRLVRGNHDIYRTREYLPYFDEIYGVRVIDGIIFSHFPLHPSSLGTYRANVHGHIHQNPSPHPVLVSHPRLGERWVPYINVSMEQINYTPVELEWIQEEIKRLSK